MWNQPLMFQVEDYRQNLIVVLQNEGVPKNHEDYELIRWEVTMQEIVAQIAENDGEPWEAEIGDSSSPFKLFLTIIFDQSDVGRMRSEIQLIEGNIEEDVITLK